MYIQKISEDTNVFGDNIGFVKLYDFSKANLNEDSRIEAITTVASVCYDNPNVIGKEVLYNRLKAEAMGLPSSSFEFVPVLLSIDIFDEICFVYANNMHCTKTVQSLDIEKFGSWIYDNDQNYLLTNYRALYNDWSRVKACLEHEGISGTTINSLDFSTIYNTEEECDVIKNNFVTFLYKMDMSTSKQHNRHRVSLQELSRRYVSGKKTPFEFYMSPLMKNIPEVLELTKQCEAMYYTALEAGVQPQEARRIIPQNVYTTIWSAFQPFQLQNYFELRDDKHAQYEIQLIAKAMKKLLYADTNFKRFE